MNPITVLVPAAGALPDPHLGPAPPFFRQPIELAAGSQLAVEQICRHYSGSTTVERLLVITDPQARLQRPLELPPATTIEEVLPQPHICATLAAALPAVKTPWVLVNPITTLPSHRPEPAPVVLIGNKRLYQENWAAFQPIADQQWQALPKGSQSLSYPFTGVLCCRTAVLRQILATLSAAQGGDLIHVASALLREHNAQALQVPWLDLGHHATLASCRRERLNSRAFNSLTYCGRGDLMLKRSQDQQRLLAEAHYLEALPPALQRHFPWSQLQGDGNAASLQLEYIPLPTLAELFLHYDIGPNAWQGLWRRLAAIRADMAQLSTPMQASPGWLYGRKLQQRWQQLTPEPWHRLPLRLNGIALPSLEQAVERTIADLQPLEQPTALSWIHGDLCFNNILGDPVGHTIRLIDPRGEPGNSSLPRGYGDPRYDLAKLHHSVFGLYDAVVNRLYELRLHADTTWDLHLYAPPNLTLVRDLFLQHVVADAMPFATLQLLSRALFLSMLPLHAEDPLRQRALAAIGLLLFTHHDPAQCANRF